MFVRMQFHSQQLYEVDNNLFARSRNGAMKFPSKSENDVCGGESDAEGPGFVGLMSFGFTVHSQRINVCCTKNVP